MNRLYVGLCQSEDAEPEAPWHHKPEAVAPPGDECPKRAAYIDAVWKTMASRKALRDAVRRLVKEDAKTAARYSDGGLYDAGEPGG